MTTDDKHTAGEMVKSLLEAAVVFEVMWNPPQAIEANRLREASTLITSQAKEIAALREVLKDFLGCWDWREEAQAGQSPPITVEHLVHGDKIVGESVEKIRSILASKGNEDV